MQITASTEIFAQAAERTLLEVLKDEIRTKNFRRISVCSAFATQKGVTELRGLMPSNAEFRWLLGLDDSFTEPGALRVAYDTRNSELRTATWRVTRTRPLFHPKLYLLDKNGNNESSIFIGSVNLTSAALSRNCEAFSLSSVQSRAEVEKLERFWRRFWTPATVFDIATLGAYRARHKRARKRRVVPPDDQPANTAEYRRAVNNTVQTATRVWIEIGSMTGFQTEQIDILKDLVPYLGIGRNYVQGDEHRIIGTSVTGRRQYRLVFYNGMWRLMNAREAFHTALTPPGTTHSPYILIFTRQGAAAYDLEIVDTGSQAARELRQNSEAAGFLRRSRGGREYGWL